MERRIIRIGVRLLDGVSSDVLGERVGGVVKTQDMLIHNRWQWHCHVVRQDTNSQIPEVQELEVGAKSNKGRRAIQINCRKNVWKMFWHELGEKERMQKIGKDGMPRLKQKLPTGACRDNSIKMSVCCWMNKTQINFYLNFQAYKMPYYMH